MIHSCQAVQNLIDTDLDFKEQVDEIGEENSNEYWIDSECNADGVCCIPLDILQERWQSGNAADC